MPLARKWNLGLPPTEWLLPLFLALLLLLPLSGVVVFWQMIQPRPEYAEVGLLTDFSETPTLRVLQTREGEHLSIWIVKTTDGWRAFDGQLRFGMMNCFFGWQPVTRRFEDPCSGAKFSRTGEFNEYQLYPYWRSIARNLDEYPVLEQNGNIVVEVSRRIPGAPASGIPPTQESD